MKLFGKLKKVAVLAKQKNHQLIFRKIAKKFGWRIDRNYDAWLKNHGFISDAKREKLRAEINQFADKPLISIVLPVYNVEEKWLRKCVESVASQIYENWELCIADDCSPSPHVRRILEEYAQRDQRIKIVYRRENGHISAASNSALELATGEFCALLDHDDELSADALFYLVKEVNRFPDADFIYTDEDKIDEKGKRYDPAFKPDFSRDLFYSLNYTTHFAVYRTEILREIGGFRVGFEGSQDYDLALRVVEKVSENRIRHIPRVLYHWRAIKGSVALAAEEKNYAHDRARQAIREHFERTGKKANVSPTVYNLHRVSYDLPETLLKASLIVAIDDDFARAKNIVDGLRANTDYHNCEIVLVAAEKLKNSPENFDFPENVKVATVENQSRAEQLNFGAAQADGEILCFVDANLKPQSADWLKELTSFAVQTEIGAVGAKIVSSDDLILHAGLIVGTEKAAESAHQYWSVFEDGDLTRLKVTNNFSAVSASCLAVRRELFTETGGFDAENFPESLFDADFCLRLREKKYRIVFTPYAELTKGVDNKMLLAERKADYREAAHFRRKWDNFSKNDPFYNPNFSYRDGSFTIKITK